MTCVDNGKHNGMMTCANEAGGHVSNRVVYTVLVGIAGGMVHVSDMVATHESRATTPATVAIT
jgi:hypothetical protein